MRYKRFFIGLALIIALLAGLSTLSIKHKGGPAKINILVAPSGSSLKLDGKGIKSGIQDVSIGQHTVSVSKDGFASQQQMVQATLKSTPFVGIILNSNSAGTKNWYQTHDIDLVQSINNQLFDQTSQNVTTANPLLKKLPYIGPGLNYRIDYGVASPGSKAGTVGIYIRYYTDQDKQNALDWIKSQEIDPNNLDIIYKQGGF